MTDCKQRRWQLRKRAAGLCVGCGQPNDQSITLCTKCATKDSMARHKAYAPTIRGPYRSKYRPG